MAMAMPGAGQAGSTSVKFFDPRGSCANANNDVLTGTRMTVTLIILAIFAVPGGCDGYPLKVTQTLEFEKLYSLSTHSESYST